jgi:hypothetical protein
MVMVFVVVLSCYGCDRDGNRHSEPILGSRLHAVLLGCRKSLGRKDTAIDLMGDAFPGRGDRLFLGTQKLPHTPPVRVRDHDYAGLFQPSRGSLIIIGIISPFRR